MGRSKVQIVLESDNLTCMEILDSIFQRLGLKKNDFRTPLKLRYDPLIEITDYISLDYRGKEKYIAKRDEK